MELTQEWITQYNRKCAVFLGMHDYSLDNEYFEKETYYCYPEKNKNPGCGYWTVLQKQGDNSFSGIFNSDWNWIMEVVEKIEKLGAEYYLGNKSFAISYTLSEGNWYSEETIVKTDRHTKEAVVQAIDQFIDWYNKQKEL
jgi:hypothetical protein